MKRFLVTGGTGSLGRALVRRLTARGDYVIVYSRDEGKHAQYFSDNPHVSCTIGDVRDIDRLRHVVRVSDPQIVIHAAALKRINDLEFNTTECIATNVQGSINVARASFEMGIKSCVLVSTDKACMPINVYGASKFMAERAFIDFNRQSHRTTFSVVRYGNVIASRGSFIPVWMKKINESKRIEVTSMDCTRFMFTLDDAVDLVVFATEMGNGSEIFIPKIKSFTMQNVIDALKTIMNVNDIECKIVGLRPGEKIHEDMLSEHELPLTFAIKSNDKYVSVLPSYLTESSRSYDYIQSRYTGSALNSMNCIQHDVNALVDLITRGIKSNDGNDA